MPKEAYMINKEELSRRLVNTENTCAEKQRGGIALMCNEMRDNLDYLHASLSQLNTSLTPVLLENLPTAAKNTAENNFALSDLACSLRDLAASIKNAAAHVNDLNDRLDL